MMQARDALRPDALGVARARSTGQTSGPSGRSRRGAEPRSAALGLPGMASGVERSEHPGTDAHCQCVTDKCGRLFQRISRTITSFINDMIATNE
jgi:hypothetical protein